MLPELCTTCKQLLSSHASIVLFWAHLPYLQPGPKSYLFRDVFERGRAEPEVVGRRGHEEQDGKRVPAARAGWVEGGHVVDIPAQGDLPVVEVLEGGVAQQLERHPVGLRARVVDEGCDSPGLESECKLMGWYPNEN